MDDLDFWRLADELTIVQAALLVAGTDPDPSAASVETQLPDQKPSGYEAAKFAIKHALLSGGIQGTIFPEASRGFGDMPIREEAGTADIHRSRVDVDSLRKWLHDRGFKTGFFFPDAPDSPDYLDTSNERYAPKLAAAVQAWLACDNPKALHGKHPKQALMKWLRENASDFGLTDDDGNPQENTIDEIAKIANWKPTGGAPKTPGNG